MTSVGQTRGAALLAAVCGVCLTLFAARGGVRLSNDSVTYLSTAEALRSGDGLRDFTGDVLTIFPPVYPTLLAPGGAGIGWALFVNVVALAAAVWLLFVCLEGRVRAVVAVGAALTLAVGHPLIRLASTAWSETVYLAVSLAVLATLRPSKHSTVRLLAGGFLAALGFLTRYAGAGLMVAGAAMVLLVAWDGGWRARLRHLALYLAPAAVLVSAWCVRNLAVSGQPLGPRFEGGTSESALDLLRRPFAAIGELIVGNGVQPRADRLIGAVVALALLGVFLVVLVPRRGRRPQPVDLGVGAFTLMSLVMPPATRLVSSNDIEWRVMSPMIIGVVFAAAVVTDAALDRWRVTMPLALGVLAVWAWSGTAAARHQPDRASTADRSLYAPALYDEIDRLPAAASLLSNHPWGVWWQSQRTVSLGFTTPRAGNSHFPLGAADTLAMACSGEAYLAWFWTVPFDGGPPADNRPDLLEEVVLEPVASVVDGTLLRLQPADQRRCEQR